MYDNFYLTTCIGRAQEGDPSAIADIEHALASTPKLAGDPELIDFATTPILTTLVTRGVVPAGTLFLFIAAGVQKAVAAMKSGTRCRLLAELVVGVAQYELANYRASRIGTPELDELQAEMVRAREQVESAAQKIARAYERRLKAKKKPRAPAMTQCAKVLAVLAELDRRTPKRRRID